MNKSMDIVHRQTTVSFHRKLYSILLLLSYDLKKPIFFLCFCLFLFGLFYFHFIWFWLKRILREVFHASGGLIKRDKPFANLQRISTNSLCFKRFKLWTWVWIRLWPWLCFRFECFWNLSLTMLGTMLDTTSRWPVDFQTQPVSDRWNQLLVLHTKMQLFYAQFLVKSLKKTKINSYSK